MHKLKQMENMLWYAIYSNGGKTQGKSQKLVDRFENFSFNREKDDPSSCK